MAAYLVVEIDVTDKAAYENYRAEANKVLGSLQGRGKIIIRGGSDGTGFTETLEGDWRPQRFVVVEFATMDDARGFYFSPEYQAALKLRQTSSRSRAFFVEGE